MKNLKETVNGILEDLVSDFLYYDRKEDENLSVEDIDNAIVNKTITIDEITEMFKNHLEQRFL
jgi:hypothetical protein